MELINQIGIGPECLKVLTEEDKARQVKVYSRLVIMIMVTSLLAALAFFTFATIIFQSYTIAIAFGLFLGIFFFNFQRLFIIASLTPVDETLYMNWIDKKREFDDLTDAKVDELKTDAARDAYLVDKKTAIRNATKNFTPRKVGFFSLFTSKLVVVLIFVLFGIIVAKGLELFIFRAQINSAIQDLLQSKEVLLDTWTRNKILTAQDGSDFLLINSNSVLVDLEFLNRGIGNWKYLMDFIVLILFLLPVILLNKSAEFLKGTIMRELVLQELRVVNWYYILSRRFIITEKAEYIKWLSNRSYADFVNRVERPNKPS